MTNLSLGFVLLIFTVLGALVMIQSVFRRKESDASFWFALMCASNGLWAICNALFYLLPNPDEALLFFEVRFVFIQLSSVFTYLFVFKALKHRMVSSKVLFVVFAIPAITLAILLTNDYHGLMRTHLVLVIEDGLRSINYAYGIWFWVHCIFCYCCLVMAAQLMVQQAGRLPRNYRSPIYIMLAGILLTIVTTLISVFSLLPISLDAAPIIVQISQIIFFFALYSSYSLDMLFTSRDAIFENSSYAILILTQDNTILDFNKKAVEIAEIVGIKPLYKANYTDLIARWKTAFSSRVFREDSTIFTVSEDGEDIHYQVTESDILNHHQNKIGSYVEIKNVTPIMTFIHQLQDYAYYDNLTGLYNRHSLAQKITEIDKEGSLPLGIISADVNYLKRVNDTYGHARGDELLKAITKIFIDCMPRDGIWARVGGDEFVGLVPCTSVGGMFHIINEVEKRCASEIRPNFLGADVAMAYRIKTDAKEDLQMLLNEADLCMYASKHDRRGR